MHIVDQEMELVKDRLTVPMSGIDPAFISNWTLESTIGQAAAELAPTLLQILERAAESDRAQARNKKKNSEQVRVIFWLRLFTEIDGPSTQKGLQCHHCTAVQGPLTP